MSSNRIEKIRVEIKGYFEESALLHDLEEIHFLHWKEKSLDLQTKTLKFISTLVTEQSISNPTL